MAEVIKGPWGKKSPERQEPTAPAAETMPTHSLGEDVIFFFKHHEMIESATERLREFKDFIARAPNGFLTEETINQNRQGLANYSLESLCSILFNNPESDWKIHPSYYEAVGREIFARIQAGRASLEPK